jgi:hypothetical protein
MRLLRLRYGGVVMPLIESQLTMRLPCQGLGDTGKAACPVPGRLYQGEEELKGRLQTANLFYIAKRSIKDRGDGTVLFCIPFSSPALPCSALPYVPQKHTHTACTQVFTSPPS